MLRETTIDRKSNLGLGSCGIVLAITDSFRNEEAIREQESEDTSNKDSNYNSNYEP